MILLKLSDLKKAPDFCMVGEQIEIGIKLAPNKEEARLFGLKAFSEEKGHFVPRAVQAFGTRWEFHKEHWVDIPYGIYGFSIYATDKEIDWLSFARAVAREKDFWYSFTAGEEVPLPVLKQVLAEGGLSHQEILERIWGEKIREVKEDGLCASLAGPEKLRVLFEALGKVCAELKAIPERGLTPLEQDGLRRREELAKRICIKFLKVYFENYGFTLDQAEEEDLLFILASLEGLQIATLGRETILEIYETFSRKTCPYQSGIKGGQHGKNQRRNKNI